MNYWRSERRITRFSLHSDNHDLYIVSPDEFRPRPRSAQGQVTVYTNAVSDRDLCPGSDKVLGSHQ